MIFSVKADGVPREAITAPQVILPRRHVAQKMVHAGIGVALVSVGVIHLAALPGGRCIDVEARPTQIRLKFEAVHGGVAGVGEISANAVNVHDDYVFRMAIEIGEGSPADRAHEIPSPIDPHVPLLPRLPTGLLLVVVAVVGRDDIKAVPEPFGEIRVSGERAEGGPEGQIGAGVMDHSHTP